MLRVPSKFSATFITKNFFPVEYANGKEYIRSINSGRCYDYAYLAYRLFPDITLWASDFHAWVEVNGKHYDSECIRGVSDYMKLPCNKRHAYPVPWDEQEPIRMSINYFKEFWDGIGGGQRHHWDSHLEVNLKNVLGARYRNGTPIFSR